jgi:hypothetical protein
MAETLKGDLADNYWLAFLRTFLHRAYLFLPHAQDTSPTLQVRNTTPCTSETW